MPGRAFLAGLLLLAAVLAATWLGLEPPAPLPSSAPARAFSAGRALSHLRRVLDAAGDGVPHPAGTEANARVREQVVAEFRKLGVEPRIARVRDLQPLPHLHAGRERRRPASGPRGWPRGAPLRAPRFGPCRARRRRRRLGRRHRPRDRAGAPGRAGGVRRGRARRRRRGIGAGRRGGVPPRPGGARRGRGGEPGITWHRWPEPALRDRRARARPSRAASPRGRGARWEARSSPPCTGCSPTTRT